MSRPATAAISHRSFEQGSCALALREVGFGGMKIEPIIIDENGGATKQVQELRNLYQRENVDAVIGYIGSGDCLAVAPVAEELKEFLILFDCGTPRSSKTPATSTSSVRPPMRLWTTSPWGVT